MIFQTKPLSASGLKSLAKSPEHYHANHLAQDRVRSESDAMLLGSLIHCMILEPEVLGKYAPMPEGMTRRGKAYTDWTEGEGFGRTVITRKMWEKATAISNRVMKNDMAMGFICGTKRGIQVETLFEWSEVHGGHSVKMNGYIDLVNHNTCRILDIKTTSNADNLSKLAQDGRWDIQAVQYMNAMRETWESNCRSPSPRYRMFFLVVEVNSPFRIRAVELSQSAIHSGRTDRDRLVAEYVRRTETGDWTGCDEPAEIEMPNWFSRTLENLNEKY